MKKKITAEVGADGMLRLERLLGQEFAGKKICVTIELSNENKVAPFDREAWRRFIEETAGSITDPSFERQPQGEYEERDTFD